MPSVWTFRMSQNLIVLPVLAQVLLTFAVLVLMGRARSRSMRANRQRLEDMSLATDKDWDENARKASNNFKNQFELPVLFYVVCLFALATRMVDMVFFALAWVFVLSRIAHTAVHLGPNVVAWRGTVYLVGFAALIGMWALLTWRIAASGW